MRLIGESEPAVWGGRMMTFSAEKGVKADVTFGELTWQNHAWRGTAEVRGACFDVSLPLVGRYNAANGAGAVSALICLGYDSGRVFEALSRVEQIPGRMQIVHESDPRVIVDFAHTPEALQSALMATSETMTGGRLTVVFGCGGDRDASKRPMMASFAQSYADRVVVTSDNPRTEDPMSIIDDIVSGLDMSRDVVVEVDRRKAIEHAVRGAMGDVHNVVLIAGKGHEDYQILGTVKTHFSDVEEVTRLFK